MGAKTFLLIFAVFLAMTLTVEARPRHCESLYQLCRRKECSSVITMKWCSGLPKNIVCANCEGGG